MILITGLGGTVGPALRAALEARGRSCTGWDRAAASPEDPHAVRAHLARQDPLAVCHLALGAESWAAELAAWCRERGRPFLFTSTAMVFDREPDGPHRPDDPRTAKDGYGQYKVRCEDQVRAANPGAVIARIGWQIGTRRGGNQMLEAFHGMIAREGKIAASRRWVPATSFLDDTAAALVGLLERDAPGTYHLDGNATSAWTFDRIARALANRHGDPGWRVEPNDDYVHDQRLVDERVAVRPIADRLS